MLTVIFSTHNGARTLPDVLVAYQQLEQPPGGWKLVVVDNGSTDSTDAILKRFQSRLPLTTLFVREPGKNRALNVALQCRDGDLVVLTDDDAVPSTNWLRELRSSADSHPDFDIFGGAIRPRWERPPDRRHLLWVPQGIAYAITDPHMPTGPAQPGAAAWGPNMAIRARIFDSGHRFDERIGPIKGISYAMGSETEFTGRLARLGYRTWFVSTAVVEHIVRSHQMTRSWIRGRAIRYGRGQYHEDLAKQGEPVAEVCGVPRYRLRRLVVAALQTGLAVVSCRREAAFRNAWSLYQEWGYLGEARIHGSRTRRDA